LTVKASDRLGCSHSACCLLAHRILEALLPFVAALASWGSASIAAAVAGPLAREFIADVVRAAVIALGLARIATALTFAAWEEMALRVQARIHAKALEPLRQVKGFGAHCEERALFVDALAVRACVGRILRCLHHEQQGCCCCKLLQGHVARKIVLL